MCTAMFSIHFPKNLYFLYNVRVQKGIVLLFLSYKSNIVTALWIYNTYNINYKNTVYP